MVLTAPSADIDYDICDLVRVPGAAKTPAAVTFSPPSHIFKPALLPFAVHSHVNQYIHAYQ
jgi:hypothetical protein